MRASQALFARLATFVSGYSCFQVVITARYSVTDLKADLQVMYRKAGIKGEGITFLFTDQQIADERFLVFMNDLLSSGNIPGKTKRPKHYVVWRGPLSL